MQSLFLHIALSLFLFSFLPFLTTSLSAVVTCPNCSHDKAAYTEFQTRSADEPASIFYQCLNDKCKHNWREDWPHIYLCNNFFCHQLEIEKNDFIFIYALIFLSWVRDWELLLIGSIWHIEGFFIALFTNNYENNIVFISSSSSESIFLRIDKLRW